MIFLLELYRLSSLPENRPPVVEVKEGERILLSESERHSLGESVPPLRMCCCLSVEHLSSLAGTRLSTDLFSSLMLSSVAVARVP